MSSLEWHILPSPEFRRTARTYEKKSPDELAAPLANLQHRYLPRLNHAHHPSLVQVGCLHHEGPGVLAIDQAGHGRNLGETRLYAFPDVTTRTLHLLLIGDKSAQKRGLRIVHETVNRLRSDPSNG